MVSRVFIVPIRNWNAETAEPAYWGTDGFYSTYKELKQYDMDYISVVEPQVFIVPIRNWNSWQLIFLTFFRIVFIVPIRNWNTQSNFPSTSLCSSFYSTYKELKPSNKWDSSFSVIVFIVPIRNWNNKGGRYQSRLIKCFYSTYKELKPW